MKRGKDEEKMMGPMFPRLHVNDADKGGPRAPPRNKMALYEQLSIPSQRFNQSMLNGSSPANSGTPSNQVIGSSSLILCVYVPVTCYASFTVVFNRSVSEFVLLLRILLVYGS